MKVTRRDTIGMMLALGFAGGSAASAQALQRPSGPSLHDLAQRTGRRFGSTVGGGPRTALTGSFADARYRELLAAECGVIVPENELKWTRVRPSADRFDFVGNDVLLEFAEEHRMAFRGHTLLWHHPRWTPQWVSSHDFGGEPRRAAAKMLRDHIETVCRRYGTRIYSYDVVNEAIDHENGAMRETPFSKHLTIEGTLDLAFHTAREAAPHAQLVYNDYMDWGAGGEKHRAGVLKLLEGFRKRNAPVDALGIQAHLSDSHIRERDESEWRRFIDESVAMGYELVITELDISDRILTGDFASRDKAIADLGKGFLDLMLTYEQLGDILLWGLVDRYSWLQGFQPREDGIAKRPCPYDSDYKPKPLREAYAAALAAATTKYVPRRRPA